MLAGAPPPRGARHPAPPPGVASAPRPTVIICHTIPGRGVRFMERDYHWHGIPPNREQADRALEELRAERAELEPVR